MSLASSPNEIVEFSSAMNSLIVEFLLVVKDAPDCTVIFALCSKLVEISG